jgi:hypothetical protein
MAAKRNGINGVIMASAAMAKAWHQLAIMKAK